MAARAAPLNRAPERGSLRALALAVAVHGAFFALIVFGVSWQIRAPQPVQAEIWDRIPTPKPVLAPDLTKPIERESPPEKPVELKTPPAIDKRPEEAKPAPPRPDPQIAERAAREKREKEKAAEKQKAAEAKKRQEEEARRKAEAEKKKQEEAVRLQREAAAAAQQAEFNKYVEGIRTRIRSRANVPDTVRGNPEVIVLIKLLPTGEVLDLTITKRSGNPAYDSAIERGIRSAQPFTVPPANTELFARFRELNLVIKHER